MKGCATCHEKDYCSGDVDLFRCAAPGGLYSEQSHHDYDNPCGYNNYLDRNYHPHGFHRCLQSYAQRHC